MTEKKKKTYFQAWKRFIVMSDDRWWSFDFFWNQIGNELFFSRFMCTLCNGWRFFEILVRPRRPLMCERKAWQLNLHYRVIFRWIKVKKVSFMFKFLLLFTKNFSKICIFEYSKRHFLKNKSILKTSQFKSIEKFTTKFKTIKISKTQKKYFKF